MLEQIKMKFQIGKHCIDNEPTIHIDNEPNPNITKI